MSQRITEDTTQYILNKSFNTNTKTIDVSIIGQDINNQTTLRQIQVDGNGMVQTTSEGYKVRVEYSGGVPLYAGFALPGTLTSATGWAIRKMTAVGDNITATDWASGTTKFDKVWDDRATYTYS
jgi:hypothetical protein